MANYNVSNDMTGRYLVHDIERNRKFMSQISQAFLGLCDIKNESAVEWIDFDIEKSSRADFVDWKSAYRNSTHSVAKVAECVDPTFSILGKYLHIRLQKLAAPRFTWSVRVSELIFLSMLT